MTNPKWEIGPVKLADGSEAWIFFVQPESKHQRYIGKAKDSDGEWRALHWCDAGRVPYTTTGHAKNLATPPKKKVRVIAMWMIIYPEGYVDIVPTEQLATDQAHKKRAFAIREIESFEVEEGEGL